MVNLLSKVAITGVVFIAILYQFIFKSIIFDTLGYGRKVQSIKDFNHIRCKKVVEPGLEACEAIWLHDRTGYLYMACSTADTRTKWLPATEFFDGPQRSLVDRIAMLDTRGSGPLASRLKWLTIENFSGNNGDGTFNLHGMDVRADKNTDTLRILLVNHRPPIDPITGKPLDASVHGANSTIEQLQTKAGSTKMRYVRTYANDLIKTPNQVAWVSDHAFVFTNDHSEKLGIRRNLDPFIGGGSVGYCDRSRCNIAYSGMKLPNGLVRGRDGLIYVPSTLTGIIDVFSITEKRLLEKITSIHVGLPIDNLSIDKNGDIYAAAFPQVYKWTHSSKDPSINPPSAVFRVRKAGKGYQGDSRKGSMERYEGDYIIKKVVEDDGSLLPGSTTVVHDAQTGRLFLAGVMSPFIVICQKG